MKKLILALGFLMTFWGLSYAQEHVSLEDRRGNEMGITSNPLVVTATGNPNFSGTVSVIGNLFVTGNTGIGTSSPTSKLEVNGDIRIPLGNRIYLVGTNDSNYIVNTGLYSVSTLGFSFFTNTLERMRITQLGNVGIGATSPFGLLQVGTAPTPGLIVLASGNVGIGTTLPATNMEINGSSALLDGSAGAFLRLRNISDTTNVTSGILFGNGSATPVAKGAIFYQDKDTFNRGDMIFANDSTADENNVLVAEARMVILNNGNVGIGNTNPTYGLLQVGTNTVVPSFTVFSNGNVGIGTTNTTSKLYVNGSVDGTIFEDVDNGSCYLNPANTNISLRILGSIVINNTTPSAKLEITPAGTEASIFLNVTAGTGVTAPLKVKSENGTTYRCGVNDSGTWSCKAAN